MAVIGLDGLSISYGPVRVLDRLTVEFPGGAMGLLGPNGAGKTTLLKTLLGLLRPESGRAEVLGLDAADRPLLLRSRVGYMPESDCYIPGMRGVQFVAYCGRLAGLSRRDSLTRAHEVLHYVGLREVRYRKVDGYSQGMRQRLRLAQALVHDPELLFLDEPTSGMDPRGREEMLALIADLASRHEKHVVLSSHLLPDVEEICSSVVVLANGRVAVSGSIEELGGRDSGVFEARLRGDAERVAGLLTEGGAEVVSRKEDRLTVRLTGGSMPLFAAAKAAGAQVRELRETSWTLEETFLRLVDESGEGA